MPIGAYATIGENNEITLTGMVGSPDGKQMFKNTATGQDPLALGIQVAEALLAQGAGDVLAQVLRENEQ